MLESTEKGEVRKTVGNYRLILMNDPNLQGAFRLNMFTDKIDITRDLGWYRESDSLTDVDLKFLVVYLEKHYGLSNEKRIEDVIKVVANENRYHPVLDRINSITWDGWERIRYALHHFLGAEVSEYTYEVMKLFMIGTIARISCPGIKFEVMLCLVGGQGAGKSTFLRFLAMEDDWFTDDLKKMDDDNVYRKIQGHLIIEFPEMVAILNAKNVEDTCLPVHQIRWISCLWTGRETEDFCLFFAIWKRRKLIYSMMKRHQGNISTRCGQRLWKSTGVANAS